MEHRLRRRPGSSSTVAAIATVVAMLMVATQAAACSPSGRAQVAQGAQAEATAAPVESESPPTAAVAPTATAAPTVTAAPLDVADIVVSEVVAPTADFPCTLFLAPEGDRTYCWAEGPTIWVGTLAGGLERVILEGSYNMSWAYDDEHLLLSPMSTPYASAQPQPVYLYDVETGERTELGQTVRGWLVRTTTTGYVSYPAEGGIEIVNPILGTRALVSLELPTPEAPAPEATEPALEETAWPEFLRATGTPLAMDSPLPTPEPTAQTVWDNYPSFQLYHEVSNDGSKIAILAQIGGQTTLWLVGIQDRSWQLVSDAVVSWAYHPFAFSPDSSSLAYTEGDDWSRPDSLQVLDIATWERRTLAEVSPGGALDWLHWLGPELVFYGCRTGQGVDNDTYYAVSAHGGQSRLLWTGGNGAGAFFSSDGHRITHLPPVPREATSPWTDTVITTLDY